MLSGIANVRVLFSDLTSFANEFNVSSAYSYYTIQNGSNVIGEIAENIGEGIETAASVVSSAGSAVKSAGQFIGGLFS
jgi:hypothetical protein